MQVVQRKCDLDPNRRRIRGAKPQTSSDNQRWRRKFKWNLPQVLPQLSSHRKRLWVYPTTKFVIYKWFHFSLHFLEVGSWSNKVKMLSFSSSHIKTFWDTAFLILAPSRSLSVSPIFRFPCKPQLGIHRLRETFWLSAALPSSLGTCWNKLHLFLELDVARGGQRGAEHDDLKRDALN